MSWNLVTDIDARWEEVAPVIARGFRDDFDDFTLEDLHTWLKAGKMRLLVYCSKDESVDLACVFEIVNHPGRRLMRIVALVGKNFGAAFPSWESEVEGFARKLGCDALEAWCRDPQARLFSRWGMEKQFNVVRKEIGHAG